MNILYAMTILILDMHILNILNSVLVRWLTGELNNIVNIVAHNHEQLLNFDHIISIGMVRLFAGT